MKKLGFGLMRLPQLDKNDPSKVDLEQLKEMVDLFLEKGLLTLTRLGCTMRLPARALSRKLW